mgnify:CR=1 FL=1
MRRNIFNFAMLALLPLLAVSCVDNIPAEETLPSDAVSFEYRCTDAKYPLDYYVGSTILFSSTSPTEGEMTWDFGDGTETVTRANGTDTVSHFFETAGTYNVKLTIAGLSRSQVIMVSDIKPLLSLNPIEDEVCEVSKTKVSFALELPNPRNLSTEYLWILPEGTKNVAGDTILTCTDTLPGDLIFSNVGSQTVRLQVKLGGRLLEEGIMNVQVGYNKPVPTLYYAEVGGHLMAYKLIDDAPEGMKNMPFDLGISSGQHAFNLLFHNSLLYMLDCGKQFYYVNDEDKVLGDGRILVISKDGKTVETMITNAGQAAFDDPFYGYIEGDYLYYANRNTGIIKVKLSDRNKVYSETEYPYYVQHTTLGYYGNGWNYGCIGGMFGKAEDVWHWCKFYNGTGIFRFTDDDILPAPIAGGEGTPPASGIWLGGTLWPKSYAYNPRKGKYCFTLMGAGVSGFYVASASEIEAVGSSSKNVQPYMKKYNGLGFEANLTGTPAAIEGTSSEGVGICQITLDKTTGNAYFGYRNNFISSASSASNAPSGIYRYNASTDAIEQVLAGPLVYGMTINPTPSKLF